MRGGISIFENQACACLLLFLRLGMQSSNSRSGMGSQSIELAAAPAIAICRVASPMRQRRLKVRPPRHWRLRRCLVFSRDQTLRDARERVPCR